MPLTGSRWVAGSLSVEDAVERLSELLPAAGCFIDGKSATSVAFSRNLGALAPSTWFSMTRLSGEFTVERVESGVTVHTLLRVGILRWWAAVMMALIAVLGVSLVPFAVALVAVAVVAAVLLWTERYELRLADDFVCRALWNADARLAATASSTKERV